MAEQVVYKASWSSELEHLLATLALARTRRALRAACRFRDNLGLALWRSTLAGCSLAGSATGAVLREECRFRVYYDAQARQMYSLLGGVRLSSAHWRVYERELWLARAASLPVVPLSSLGCEVQPSWVVRSSMDKPVQPVL